MKSKRIGKTLSLCLRLTCLEHLSGVLSDFKRDYALLMAEEMGKPIRQGIGEIEKCIWLCNYYVSNSENTWAIQKSKLMVKKVLLLLNPLD